MNDLISRKVAIDTEGLDAEIRCEMCKNSMHTDRGCDGHCEYDEKLYEKIMQILDERIKPLPSAQPEIVRCGQCKYAEVADAQDNQDGYTCQFHRGSIWFSGSYCSWGERRTG